jgi:NAD(P)-dependent dehydrogenase (short-subunit alcohol dehydrogenase family)
MIADPSSEEDAIVQNPQSPVLKPAGALENKVAVITGSSRGLGLAIAQAYAREGAAVILSSRTASAVEEAVQSLRAAGYRASGLPIDIGHREQVEALAAHAIEAFGGFDIWINNAGVSGPYGPGAHYAPEYFERVVQTNILGSYYGSVVAIRHFFPRHAGKLINLLGRGDTGPSRHQSAYAASKAWTRNFTLTLAKDYAHSGIGIFAFNPGLVDTDLLRQVTAVQGYERRLKPLETVIRLWAKPPDVPAQRAVWLASSATDGKTGIEARVLSRAELISGLLREAGRILRREPARDTSLSITSVPAQLPVE